MYCMSLAGRLYPPGVTADRAAYAVDDRIIVTIAVRNASPAPITLEPLSLDGLIVRDALGGQVHCLGRHPDIAMRQIPLTLEPGETDWLQVDGHIAPGPVLDLRSLSCPLPGFGTYTLSYAMPLILEAGRSAEIEVVKVAPDRPRGVWGMLFRLQERFRALPFVRYRLTRTTTVEGLGEEPYVITDESDAAAQHGMPSMASNAMSVGHPLKPGEQQLWDSLEAQQRRRLARLLSAHAQWWRRARPTAWTTGEFSAQEPVRILWAVPLIGPMTLGYINRQGSHCVTFSRNGVALKRTRVDREAGLRVTTVIETTDLAFKRGTAPSEAPGTSTDVPKLLRPVYELDEQVSEVEVLGSSTNSSTRSGEDPATHVITSVTMTEVNLDLLGDVAAAAAFARQVGERTRCVPRPSPQAVKPWTGGKDRITWVLECPQTSLEVAP